MTNLKYTIDMNILEKNVSTNHVIMHEIRRYSKRKSDQYQKNGNIIVLFHTGRSIVYI